MRSIVALVMGMMLAGCMGQAPETGAVRQDGATPPTFPPLCSWSMTAPAENARDYFHPSDGVNCDSPIPAGDGRWQVGLFVAGYILTFHVAEGEMDAGGGVFHLLEQGSGVQSCSSWAGRASFSRSTDAWSLSADVVCLDDGPPVRVALDLSGR